METAKPRAFRMRPMEATVMPFPTDDTTPPVTKMYLASLIPLLSSWLQHDHLRLSRQRGLAHRQLGLRHHARLADFMAELLHRCARRAQSRQLEVHGHDHSRLDQVDHLDRFGGVDGLAVAGYRNEQHVHVGQRFDVAGGYRLLDLTQVAQHQLVHLDLVPGADTLALAERRTAKDQHILDLVLAGAGDGAEGAARRGRLGGLPVADGYDVGSELLKGGGAAEGVWVGDNAGLFPFEAEAGPAMPGQLQAVVSEMPTSPAAFATNRNRSNR